MMIVNKILLALIKIYQTGISPLIPARCRYYPSCSEYGKTALEWHSAIYGSRLLIIRLSHCHPLGGSGIDFVPIPLYRYQFTYVSHGTAVAKNINHSLTLKTLQNRSQIYATVYQDKISYRPLLNYLLQKK